MVVVGLWLMLLSLSCLVAVVAVVLVPVHVVVVVVVFVIIDLRMLPLQFGTSPVRNSWRRGHSLTACNTALPAPPHRMLNSKWSRGSGSKSTPMLLDPQNNLH